MRNILGDYQWFHEGFGLLGLAEEVTLPEVKWKTNDYDGGGLLGTRDLKTVFDKFKISVKCAGFDPRMVSAAGLMPGVSINFKLMASMIDPGNPEVPQKILFTGEVSTVKRDTYKAASKVLTEYEITDLTYYEEWFDGKEVLAIDWLNQILRVNGTDQMTQRRRNTGRL